ncbi:LysR family transcriptional regulator substrate-binding protein [Nonomuraea sp. 3N208]|uniref:LysR family transcriptional regulator substrate-binding protein n=1 Tax=Nonomuraea sp. 3N208 TaxID=3457421 RepID=UPI003FD5ECA4
MAHRGAADAARHLHRAGDTRAGGRRRTKIAERLTFTTHAIEVPGAACCRARPARRLGVPHARDVRHSPSGRLVHSAAPQVELGFIEGSGPETQEEMLAGRAQVCAIREAQLVPGCSGEVLRETRRMVALSPRHHLAPRGSIELAELAQCPATIVDEEPALQRTLAAFAAAGVEPRVVWRPGRPASCTWRCRCGRWICCRSPGGRRVWRTYALAIVIPR